MTRILLFLFHLLCNGFLANGQTEHNRLSLQLSQNLRDFNISLLSNKLTSFDSALSQTYRAGIQYYISSHWALGAGINNGFLVNQMQEKTLIKKSFLTSLDAELKYKFNNGKFLKEHALIGPFVSFGYELSYLYKNKAHNLNTWQVNNSYGLGVNVSLSEANNILVQMGLNQQIGGDFTTFVNYRLGYAYTFGSKQSADEKPSKPIKDRDNDGIADEFDQCPDEAGLAKYAGCNVAQGHDTLLKLSHDSLRQEVAVVKTILDSLRSEVGVVRTLMESHVAAEKEHKTEIPANKPVIQESKPAIIAETPKVETKPVVKEKTTIEQNNGFTYYVIAISTLDRSLAVLKEKELANAYPVVKILPQPNGFYRVGIYATASRSEALKILDYAKTHGVTQAWLSYE